MDPDNFTPFYKMWSFWLMVPLPILIAIIWLTIKPELLMS